MPTRMASESWPVVSHRFGILRTAPNRHNFEAEMARYGETMSDALWFEFELIGRSMWAFPCVKGIFTQNRVYYPSDEQCGVDSVKIPAFFWISTDYGS